jgi:hypothetical protein
MHTSFGALARWFLVYLLRQILSGFGDRGVRTTASFWLVLVVVVATRWFKYIIVLFFFYFWGSLYFVLLGWWRARTTMHLRRALVFIVVSRWSKYLSIILLFLNIFILMDSRNLKKNCWAWSLRAIRRRDRVSYPHVIVHKRGRSKRMRLRASPLVWSPHAEIRG